MARFLLDNSKYLYLNTFHNYQNILPVWISYNKGLVGKLRKLGFNAYYAWSFRGTYFCLRAGFYFIDHGFEYEGVFSPINIWLSGNAKIIQLWHGLGIKKIGTHDSKSFSNNFYENLKYPANYNINKYMVTPRSFAGIFASAFQIPDRKVIISGLPRNDVFLNIHKPIEISNIEKFRSLKNIGKILFYLPTFRDHGGNPFEGHTINLFEFDRFLERNNCFLVVKMHKYDKSEVHINKYERILILPQDFDMYEILPLGDMLITDYSGVFLDFLMADKPIIFFPYDLKQFLKINRDLYFDYETFVPGPIASNFGELLNYIQVFFNSEQPDNFKERRERLKKKIFDNATSSSSDTIAQWIIKKEHL